MKNEERYELTLVELQTALRESGDFSESGMIEILNHDLYYFPIFKTMEFNSRDYIGFFLIYLKDGIALIPIYEAKNGDGWERIAPSEGRYINEDDYELLCDSKASLQRKLSAIDKSIESLKLKLLVNRGINLTEEN